MTYNHWILEKKCTILTTMADKKAEKKRGKFLPCTGNLPISTWAKREVLKIRGYHIFWWEKVQR